MGIIIITINRNKYHYVGNHYSIIIIICKCCGAWGEIPHHITNLSQWLVLGHLLYRGDSLLHRSGDLFYTSGDSQHTWNEEATCTVISVHTLAVYVIALGIQAFLAQIFI